MRAKVLCNVLVYNGAIYYKGNYLEVESDSELERLIEGRSVSVMAEKETSEATGKQHYAPSDDAIEEVLTSPDRNKKKVGRVKK